jgi:methylenetetrahydrofolate dehydrogenase (NADP+)/methenyltetrahydrofolate cyclohydrolase
MVQLPLPLAIRHQTLTIIDSTNPKKDVDGLRDDSLFVHPTAMAVLQIIKEAKKLLIINHKPLTICVVGATGMVGSALLREIKNTNYKLVEKPEEADILVSATGSPNLIKTEMVKEGSMIIDVGSPKGDMDPSVYSKAGFYTPVPGGVGPVTISCLLENLIVSAGKVC